jgi:large-conductance mechanosensitive channel
MTATPAGVLAYGDWIQQTVYFLLICLLILTIRKCQTPTELLARARVTPK